MAACCTLGTAITSDKCIVIHCALKAACSLHAVGTQVVSYVSASKAASSHLLRLKHIPKTFPACTHQEHVSTSPCLSDTHKQHVTIPYCLSVADQQHIPIPPCLPPTHKQQVQVHAVSHSPTSSTFQYALSRCTRCTSLPSTVHTKKSSQSLSSTSMSPCTCGT